MFSCIRKTVFKQFYLASTAAARKKFSTQWLMDETGTQDTPEFY
jgi:hypothetical protein